MVIHMLLQCWLFIIILWLLCAPKEHSTYVHDVTLTALSKKLCPICQIMLIKLLYNRLGLVSANGQLRFRSQWVKLSIKLVEFPFTYNVVLVYMCRYIMQTQWGGWCIRANSASKKAQTAMTLNPMAVNIISCMRLWKMWSTISLNGHVFEYAWRERGRAFLCGDTSGTLRVCDRERRCTSNGLTMIDSLILCSRDKSRLWWFVQRR